MISVTFLQGPMKIYLYVFHKRIENIDCSVFRLCCFLLPNQSRTFMQFFYPICCKCKRLFPLKAFSVSHLYYSILYIRVNEGYQGRLEDWGSLDER